MARIEMAAAGMTETTALSADALFNLGMMYCIGRGVAMDLIAAHKWFNIASLRGSEEAKRYRQEISREMSTDDVAEAQRQARSWLAKA